MLSLKDWTSYVFLGMFVGSGLAILYVTENWETYSTQETADKQWNEPEIKQGTWRMGKLPERGAPIERGSFVVYRLKSETVRVGRVVAVAGQKVEVTPDDVLVDGQPFVPPVPKQKASRFEVPEMVVPRGCVFVVVDQRQRGGASEQDSRFLGPIPVEAVTHTFKPLGSAKGER